jgi:hypothetical protein
MGKKYGINLKCYWKCMGEHLKQKFPHPPPPNPKEKKMEFP